MDHCSCNAEFVTNIKFFAHSQNNFVYTCSMEVYAVTSQTASAEFILGQVYYDILMLAMRCYIYILYHDIVSVNTAIHLKDFQGKFSQKTVVFYMFLYSLNFTVSVTVVPCFILRLQFPLQCKVRLCHTNSWSCNANLNVKLVCFVHVKQLRIHFNEIKLLQCNQS